MKKLIFEGAATALITPTNENGVDYEKFGKLLDWQISEGIDALVILGTSGECATLSDEEHKKALEFAIEKINGRVPAIAGTGSNDTAYSVSLTKFADKIGYDAALVVTPYYNKATQEGLVKSFSTIADASEKPIIMYNVPSRTGCNILPNTCLKLSKHPNIVAIKEASGNISQIAETAALCDDDLTIYSGNDDQIVPIMSIGGKGVISVLSNLLPKETSKLCHLYLEGKVNESKEMQLRYLKLINALFCEVNPIPVKAAMAHMGYCDNFLRLPLTTLSAEHEKELVDLMQKAGIKVK